MVFGKEINGKLVTIECDNENLISLYLREGFEEVKTDLKKK